MNNFKSYFVEGKLKYRYKLGSNICYNINNVFVAIRMIKSNGLRK